METGDRESEVVALVEESACSDEAVEFVVTFGSRVTGETTRGSDLDLAVKFADGCSGHDRFERLFFLSGDLQRENAPFIDVSDIETLPLPIAHDAVNGVFVCGDETAFEEYKTDVQAAFADQHEEIRRHQRSVIDRIAEEGLRG